ncbi:MAG: glycosyltransferase family 4 protein [Deltaproteobacteria bacterium]|nr:glycosyltransferase family 4 protein [Deltaproteobacteria bacterium]
MPNSAPKTSKGIKSLRVLNICHESAVGGAQVSVTRACAALKMISAPVRFEIAARGKGFLSASAIEQGCMYFEQPCLSLLPHLEESRGRNLLKAMSYPSQVMLLALWLQRLNPSIVHIHSALLQAPAHAAASLKIPVVWTVHEMLEKDSPHLAPMCGPRRLANTIAKISSKIIVTAEAAAKAFLILAPGTDVTIVRVGFDMEPFKDLKKKRSAARKRLNIPLDEKVVLFPGYLARKKGFPVLVKALESFKGKDDTGHPVPLLLARGRGDVEAAGNLAGMAGIRADISGPTSHPGDMADLYAAADLVVVPSLSETQSLVAIEAMAAKIPVAASRVGDLDLYLDPVQLSVPGDHVTLARSIEMMLYNRELAEALVQKAAKKVQKMNSPRAYGSALLSIYTSISRAG